MKIKDFKILFELRILAQDDMGMAQVDGKAAADCTLSARRSPLFPSAVMSDR